jgi:hypothetical protein
MYKHQKLLICLKLKTIWFLRFELCNTDGIPLCTCGQDVDRIHNVAPLRVARWYIFKPKILIWAFWGGLKRKRFGNLAIWYIIGSFGVLHIWPFGILYGHLVNFMVIGNLVAIWYISPHFGLLCQEKSGNPGPARHKFRLAEKSTLSTLLIKY